jgi:hypothetical protein
MRCAKQQKDNLKLFHSYDNIYPYFLRSIFYAVKRSTETLILGTIQLVLS